MLAAAPALATAQPPAEGDVATVASACGGDITHGALAAMPRDQAHAKMACFTREAARLFNAELPMKTDEHTILERVEADGTRITFHNRLTVAAAEIPAGMFDLLEKDISTGTCEDAETRGMIGLGGSYRYIWRDKAGATLDELVVDRC